MRWGCSIDLALPAYRVAAMAIAITCVLLLLIAHLIICEYTLPLQAQWHRSAGKVPHRRTYRSSMGMTKAAVLPDPVRAMPTTSWRCSMSGIVLRWIGVGNLYPLRLMPRTTSKLSPRESA